MGIESASSSSTATPGVSYGEPTYWEERYKKEMDVVYDWYQSYNNLSYIFNRLAPKDSRILMVGCGNSELSAEMASDGYQDIYNIDISSTVIEQMKQRYSSLEQCNWEVMDATNLSYADETFDVVIDKGTLDALLCGDSGAFGALKLLTEAHRVLKPDGLYILVTYGDPRSRLIYLEKEKFNWNVDFHVIPRLGCDRFTPERVKEFVDSPLKVDSSGKIDEDLHCDDRDIHFIYVCRKEDSKK